MVHCPSATIQGCSPKRVPAGKLVVAMGVVVLVVVIVKVDVGAGVGAGVGANVGEADGADVGAGVGAGIDPCGMAAAHLPPLPNKFVSLFGVFITVSDSQLAM